MKYELDLPIGHQLPTKNRAASADGPGRCLKHLMGPLVPPSQEPVRSSLCTFSQNQYTHEAVGWTKTGLVYIPSACRCRLLVRTAMKCNYKCKLHVRLHDCGTRDAPFAPPATSMSDEESEFTKYAEKNQVILLMPRLKTQQRRQLNTKCTRCFSWMLGRIWTAIEKLRSSKSSPHGTPHEDGE